MSEEEILKELDRLHSSQSMIEPGKIGYTFFGDLEHGYCETAASRIHLFADADRWALVFEKAGYYNRGFFAGVELNNLGNCITRVRQSFGQQKYESNVVTCVLVSEEELNRIGNDVDEIDPDVKEVRLRDQMVPVPFKNLTVGGLMRAWAD